MTMMKWILIGGLGVSALSLSLAASAETETGASMYEQHCAGCHQPAGEGMAGAFPPLAGAALVKGDPKAMIAILLQGKGVGMPPFGASLTDADIAAIVNHTRTSWGNAASTVTAADVAEVRATAH